MKPLRFSPLNPPEQPVVLFGNQPEGRVGALRIDWGDGYPKEAADTRTEVHQMQQQLMRRRGTPVDNQGLKNKTESIE